MWSPWHWPGETEEQLRFAGPVHEHAGGQVEELPALGVEQSRISVMLTFDEIMSNIINFITNMPSLKSSST